MLRKLIILLINSLFINIVVADEYSNKEQTTNIVVTPSIAYRYDVFKWSTPDDIFKDKKLSELIWKNYIVQPGIKIELEPTPNEFTFLGQVKYGYILKSNSKSWDRDWSVFEQISGNIQSNLYSNTLSSVKGNVLDLLGAAGYSVKLFKDNLLTFYIGYDYTDYRNKQYGIHQQVNNSNDLLYPLNQLISKYNFKTQAPWIGLSFNTPLNDKFSITPTIKYYSFKYIGKGYWLLRYDLNQNPSFKHNANGKGLGFDVNFLYKYSDNLDFKINLETKKFKMKSGKDIIFYNPASFRGGKIVTNKLFDLSLVSSSISGGISYKF